jgi:hypothetical protein
MRMDPPTLASFAAAGRKALMKALTIAHAEVKDFKKTRSLSGLSNQNLRGALSTPATRAAMRELLYRIEGRAFPVNPLQHDLFSHLLPSHKAYADVRFVADKVIGKDGQLVDGPTLKTDLFPELFDDLVTVRQLESLAHYKVHKDCPKASHSKAAFSKLLDRVSKFNDAIADKALERLTAESPIGPDLREWLSRGNIQANQLDLLTFAAFDSGKALDPSIALTIYETYAVRKWFFMQLGFSYRVVANAFSFTVRAV